ncbi:MAG: glycosyltransferase [Vicinamibacterales bacterium]
MRRLLMISPHFPPDQTAGAHRVRVLAPYLEAMGWRPTVLTVDPRDYEGQLDEELVSRLPADLDVVRCRAVPAEWSRRVGFGDLGLRALPSIARTARELVESRRIDAVYVTTYPVYPALVGPRLKRQYRLPFVLDLQDPWVGAWGAEVGPGPGGRPDARSRASRLLARWVERRVLPKADALTGVSSALLDELAERYPVLQSRPRRVMPIGLDPADLAWVDQHPKAMAVAPAAPGLWHLCYVGTLLPLGWDTMRAVFAAVRQLRDLRPALAARLRLHFVGTSNEARADAPPRVRDLAVAEGVGDLVTEYPARVPFLDALRVLRAADAVLVAGTSEARYTASKLQPAIASGRPVLAIVHRASDVARLIAPVLRLDPAVRFIGYDEQTPPFAVRGEIAVTLAEWLESPPPRPTLAAAALAGQTAPELAADLAGLLDGVVWSARG